VKECGGRKFLIKNSDNRFISMMLEHLLHQNKRSKVIRRALNIPEKNMYIRKFVIWI